MPCRSGWGHLDTFSHFGSFSGTVMRDLDVKTSYGGVLQNGAEFNRKCRLMFIAAGTVEQSRLDAARHARAELDKVGVRYVGYDSPGTDHEWLTWRRSLHEFAAKAVSAGNGVWEVSTASSHVPPLRGHLMPSDAI